MKSASALMCKVVLAVVVGILVILPFGCSTAQPGETVAEGSRRHHRVLQTDQKELMADIDTFLLLDQPSKLTDKRIP